MQFKNDNRGVSEVIGAILVFGLLIALMAITQTQAIPMANEEVEFNHNQKVQEDFVGLHDQMVETGSSGEIGSSNVKMGTQYPARMIFFSPGAPAGTLSTSDQQEVTFENAKAESKFEHLTTEGLTTRHLSFDPGYNEYKNAPETRYEYGTVYNDHENAQMMVNPGGVVNDNDIMLTFVEGQLSKTTSSTMSVETRPVSAPGREVTISPQNEGEDIVLNLPSELDKDKWNEAISSDRVTAENTEGGVRLVLDPGEYNLRMAQVGVGSDTPEQSPEYLYPNAGDDQMTVNQGQTVELAEVRDKYNNPVSGVDVTVEVTADGETVDSKELTTNDDGVVTYTGFDVPGQKTVDITIKEDVPPEKKSLQMDIWVSDDQTIGIQPNVDISIEDTECVDDDTLADLLIDLGGIIDEITGGDTQHSRITVDWSTDIPRGDSGIDTVELRLVDEKRQIVDDARFSFLEDDEVTQEASETTDLIEVEGCGSNYEVQLISESTRGIPNDDSVDVET